jgi:hypothetical protein
MKSAFVIACFAAVNCANANIIADAKQFFAELPVTRQEAIRKSGTATPVHRAPTLTQQHQAIQAHHNLRAQRERLGLPKMGAGSNHDLQSTYTEMGGLTGLMLGVASGVQYNSAAGTSDCFTTVEGFSVALNSVGHIISHIYMPWYAPEAMQLFQDSTALTAGFYTTCQMDKLINNLTGLVSVEGLSTLSARGGTSLLTLGPKFLSSMKEPNSSSFMVGQSFGKLFSAISGYSI